MFSKVTALKRYSGSLRPWPSGARNPVYARLSVPITPAPKSNQPTLQRVLGLSRR